MSEKRSNSRLTTLRDNFIRFALVGGVATASQYLILVFMVELVGIDAVFSSAVGFALSSVLNYRLNYSFTFRSELAHGVAFPKFLVTAMVGLAINTLSMFLLVDFAKLYYLISQLIATAVTLVWNFSINSLWSFRSETAKRGES